jgi:tRNA pseudouridine55 synthase
VSDGVIVVDKPAGMTSHDVVDEVRRRLRTRRVGHAGTLDPDATGVLVVGVGRATRLLQFAQSSAKRYRAEVVFGVSTTTQDASGVEVLHRPAEGLTRAALERALRGFVGDIEQMPPMVSAVKIGGERLYAKARRGEEVNRAARRVTVFALQLVAFVPGEQARATLDVRCSAGTYVRTLAHDIGERIGCGAHLGRLRRVEASGFGEADAIPLDSVGPHALRPLVDAVRELPRVAVDADEAHMVSHGRPLPATSELADGGSVAILRDAELLAVYVRRGDALVAERVVPR